jgi:hypothetical protein
MKLAQTTTTTIDRPIPAALTCALCPFAHQIEDDRYCCQVSETAADVVRGHWTAKVSCHESIAQAQAEAEKAAQAPIAQTDKTAAPAPATLSAEKPAPATTPTTPTAIGTDNEPPNRGDNGRGRVQPMPVKKLMLLIVPVARITSDMPASNFDRNEFELLGELSLTLGGFAIPPVVVRDTSGYKVISGHLQYRAAVRARQLNPRTGENIPVLLLESENQSVALAQLKMLRFAT